MRGPSMDPKYWGSHFFGAPAKRTFNLWTQPHLWYDWVAVKELTLDLPQYVYVYIADSMVSGQW